MADVLGKYSFLETPDVNGDNVLLTTNPVAAGTGSLTLPKGTTAQRPASPISGMQRFNTTLGVAEYYDGSAWVAMSAAAPSGIVQTVIGNINTASSNSTIPYDNSTPQISEGFQIWSQSFTPLYSTSTIVIITSGFYTVSSSSNIYTTLAYFNGATSAIFAQLAGFSTSTGEGRGFSTTATFASGSTTARTYSCRMGPQAGVTVYYMQGTGGQAYGGTNNSGRYIIQEIL